MENLTIEDVAAILGRSVSTIRRWVKQGRLHPTREQHRFRFTHADVRATAGGQTLHDRVRALEEQYIVLQELVHEQGAMLTLIMEHLGLDQALSRSEAAKWVAAHVPVNVETVRKWIRGWIHDGIITPNTRGRIPYAARETLLELTRQRLPERN